MDAAEAAVRVYERTFEKGVTVSARDGGQDYDMEKAKRAGEAFKVIYQAVFDAMNP